MWLIDVSAEGVKKWWITFVRFRRQSTEFYYISKGQPDVRAQQLVLVSCENDVIERISFDQFRLNRPSKQLFVARSRIKRQNSNRPFLYAGDSYTFNGPIILLNSPSSNRSQRVPPRGITNYFAASCFSRITYNGWEWPLIIDSIRFEVAKKWII